METDLSPRPIDLAQEPAFSLGAIQVRPATLEVVAGDRREQLEPRVMQVLVALAGKRGEVVSRDELIVRCWAGRVVGDDAINRSISRLRKLDEAIGGLVVETVPRVGYRLLPDLGRLPESAAYASIAVLPFSNMSADPEQEYFSDGISEDIITDLSKVSALSVIGREAAFALKGQAIDLGEVSRRLGVRYVLTGSVRKADGRVRISAQLIDAATSTPVWAERYDHELDRIFDLQDDISQAIVEALKVKLLPAERSAIAQRGTDNLEAYELYLMARRKYVSGNQGDPQWAESIIRLSERSVQIDPKYALAWAHLALGHVAAGYLYGAPSHAAVAAVDRALALDPDLAEAHMVRARILSDVDRHDEAILSIETALRLNPRSGMVAYNAGVIFFAAQRIEAAITRFETALALDPADFISAQFLMGCHEQSGNKSAARQTAAATLRGVEDVLSHDRNNGFAMAVGADALGVLGQYDRARDWLNRGLFVEPANVLARMNAAGVLATHLGEPEVALDLLEQVVPSMGRNLLELLRRAHNFQVLQAYPRFRAMLAAAATQPPG